MPLNTDLDPVNLNDETFFERGDVHAYFRALRHTDPVHWSPGDADVKGFWSLTKWEDIRFVSCHPSLFTSSRGYRAYDPRDQKRQLASTLGQPNHLLGIDPPRHARLRRLVARGFTPASVRRLEPRIREIVHDILAAAATKRECDFVVDVAAQIPLAVVCDMLGIPPSEWPVLFDLTNRIVGAADPEYQSDIPDDERGTMPAMVETNRRAVQRMHEFLAALVSRRRVEPGSDVISVLLAAEDEGRGLTDEEVLWFGVLLVVAGNETTRHAMSGAVLALSEHPGQRNLLLADRSRIPVAVEEILRFVSPVLHMARVATEAVVLRGRRIRPGERVVMWYPAGNRDEDIFADPDRFDVTRHPNEHLTFGVGEHFCLGAGLARLELSVLLDELLRRCPEFEVTGPPTRLRSNFIAGFKHLPVVLRLV